MVIVGNFSVRIVNAEDKKPFQEHIGPGRKIFAEVEPDIEYLIEIQVVGGENPDQMYNFSFEVDGQSLGYHCTTNYNSGNSFHGILSRESGIEKLKALRLQRPEFKKDGESTSRRDIMGYVKVKVGEAIAIGTCNPRDFSGASMQAKMVDSGLNHGQTKKVLRSGEGSLVEESKPRTNSNRIATKYAAGEHLETITVNYCTALGLIQAGVLDKPTDMWAAARMTNPIKVDSNPDAVDGKHKRVEIGARYDDNGVKLEAPKEVDMYEIDDSSVEEVDDLSSDEE